jgi:hypothetical protein
MKKSVLFFLLALASTAVLYAQPTDTPELSLQNTCQQRFTFKADDVVPAKDTLPTTPYKDILDHYLVESGSVLPKEYREAGPPEGYVAPIRKLECFSRDRHPLLYPQTNGFYATAFKAYSEHRPLVLSPDIVWLVIAQGFAIHVNENSEAMRHFFVHHQGKQVLEVAATDKIRLGDDKSDWESVFRQFHDSIAVRTNAELAELVAGRFSGTNSDAAVAFDVTLMSSMKTYFDYWGSTMCGIPEITLEGTPEDWRQIENRAAQLAKYDLDWWIKEIQPILVQFTKTAAGQPDRHFWAGMIKDAHEETCGVSNFITGWIAQLFPYITNGEKLIRNPIIGLKKEALYTDVPKEGLKPGLNNKVYLLCEEQSKHHVVYIGPKISSDNIPSGVATTILNFNDNGVYHKLELIAGFLGMRQDGATKALRPEIGWAIIETGEKPDQDVIKAYEDRNSTPSSLNKSGVSKN